MHDRGRLALSQRGVEVAGQAPRHCSQGALDVVGLALGGADQASIASLADGGQALVEHVEHAADGVD